MRWVRVAAAMMVMAAAPVAAMISTNDAVTGMALPVGGVEAAAWRPGGAQALTVDRSGKLLFWAVPEAQLIDTMPLPGLPPPLDWATPIDRRTTLVVSRDGRMAAVSVTDDGVLKATLVVDLIGQKVVARLDRAALSWTAEGLVAGPAAGCAAACDFVMVDPATLAARPLGTGFGNGRRVAFTVDGTRLATLTGSGAAQTLVVWSTATWTPLARAALGDGKVVEIGFDAAGRRAFARQAGRKLTTVAVDDGTTTTATLSSIADGPALATDLDRREFLTARGRLPLDAPVEVGPDGRFVPIPVDASFEMAFAGKFQFFTADAQFGAIYVWDDNTAAAVGARPAEPNAFPWQVELQYKMPAGSDADPLTFHNCGGSLIRPGWVLTATHCFLSADGLVHTDAEVIDRTLVRAGTVDLTDDMAEFDVAAVFIKRCPPAGGDDCFHDFDRRAKPPTPPVNDIALLRIVPRNPGWQPRGAGEPHVVLMMARPGRRPEPVPDPPAIAPIALPRRGSEPAAALPVTMTGWGATSDANRKRSRMSAQLNRIDVAVVPRDACSARDGIAPLATTAICAGLADDSQLACGGDSGGPLVADIAHKPVLVGIVSWGSCLGGVTVYTRVAAFVPWIEATIAAAEARR